MAAVAGSKICSKCGEEKLLQKFSKDSSRKSGRASQCNQCRNSRDQKTKRSHRTLKAECTRDSWIKRNCNGSPTQERNYALILREKSKPCTDCKKCYPHYVMDFDHIGTKNCNVSSLKYGSLERLKAEISLCELVCSNCHRERTAKRAGYSI